jgi:hypothetical protein
VNIFYLDRDPCLAATAQCDAHVVKMILESAQMLCTAAHVALAAQGRDTAIVPYRVTHKNHPSTVWVRQDWSHAEWLVDHARALGWELTHRFGSVHSSIKVVDAMWQVLADVLPFGRWSDPPLAMPDDFKQADPVLAYRAYYRSKRDSGMKWRYTRRTPPSWLEVRHREREMVA